MMGSIEVCQVCWDGKVDVDNVVLVYRGPWLKHAEVLCDKRKVYSCATADKDGHCACDGFSKLDGMSGDTYTTTYDGAHHSMKEVKALNSLPDKWDAIVIEELKKEAKLHPKLELLWSAILYSGNIPAKQFGVSLNEIHRMTSLTAKMELAANREQWMEARSEILDNWASAEGKVEAALGAVCRRQMSEYICGRSQARIAQGHASEIGAIQIKHVKDPLLKQMIGGSWCGLTYICFEGIHTKLPLTLSRAAYVDACGSTLNSWASIHRDLSTDTANNAINYYGGTGMSSDLKLVLESCLHLDGPGVRSSLSLIDLNDQTSRYKFTENYWHCRAMSYKKLEKGEGSLSKRLSSLYGYRNDIENCNTDVFNYIFTRESYEPDHHLESNHTSLLLSMEKSFAHKRDAGEDFKKLICLIEKMIFLMENLKQASDFKNHSKIITLSREYRQLKLLIWSMELKEHLPIGSALAATYILTCWFIENMDDVDLGYQMLKDSKFHFV